MMSWSVYRTAVVLGTALALLVPLVAMQFSDDVVWGVADFVVAGILLVGAGLAFERIARKLDSVVYRAAVAVAVGAALLLVWVNLAVGIIGSEDDPANVMYIGVLAVGFIGAIASRFRPHGMARTMLAMALAQALAAVVALIAGWDTPESGPVEILGATALFVAMFTASALLFQNAARAKMPATAGRES